MISANLIFWLYAYALTLCALFLAFRAVKKVRRGDYAGHAKQMDYAITLILVFVASYVLKVIILGREPKTNWELPHFIVLYIHEAFIACMLVSGTIARVLAAKFKASLFSNGTPTALDKTRRKKHRLAGKICLLATSMAILTATFILHTMYTLG